MRLAVIALEGRLMKETAILEGNRRSRPGSKGIARRETIMDAAEQLFAEKGYYGASMRDISQQSGAALGLITHHFATKEALFRDVVDRKRDALIALIAQSIDAAESGPNPSASGLIRAFLHPFLQVSADETSPLHHYVRLTSHLMSNYRDPELTEPLQRLRPVSDLFTDALRRRLGETDDGDFLSAVYIIESAMIFMTQDSSFIRDLTDDRVSKTDLDQFVDRAARFFAGGIAALGQGAD